MKTRLSQFLAITIMVISIPFTVVGFFTKMITNAYRGGKDVYDDLTELISDNI